MTQKELQKKIKEFKKDIRSYGRATYVKESTNGYLTLKEVLDDTTEWDLDGEAESFAWELGYLTALEDILSKTKE